MNFMDDALKKRFGKGINIKIIVEGADAEVSSDKPKQEVESPEEEKMDREEMGLAPEVKDFPPMAQEVKGMKEGDPIEPSIMAPVGRGPMTLNERALALKNKGLKASK